MQHLYYFFASCFADQEYLSGCYSAEPAADAITVLCSVHARVMTAMNPRSDMPKTRKARASS
jgi:hypothetical protein